MSLQLYREIEQIEQRLRRWPNPRVLTDEQPNYEYDEIDRCAAEHNEYMLYFAGLSTLQATIGTSFQWNAQNNLTGAVYQPVSNSGNIQKRYPAGTAVLNSLSGGADQVFSFQQGISAGASVTVNLIAMTNLLQQAAAIVRIKSYQIRLLSAADDATLSPAPTATSKVTVTNNGAIDSPTNLDFGANGTGLTVILVAVSGPITAYTILSNGTTFVPLTNFAFAPQATNGSGAYFVGTIGSTGSVVTVVSVAAGTGYTSTTCPAVVLGQYTLGTGNAHMSVDISAAGVVVSAAAKNLLIKNNDGTNAVTVEIDVIGATT